MFKAESTTSDLDPFSLKESEVLEDLSPHWARGFTSVAVFVIKSYPPFTSAVVLEVEAVDTSQNVSLPKRFILKLNDRRFGNRYSFAGKSKPWNPTTEYRLVDGVRLLLNPQRGTPIPEEFSDFPGPHEPREKMEDWMNDLYTWKLKYRHHLAEVLAYRYLRALQDVAIPRLFGTVRLPISCSDFTHPSVDFVNGLALSVINGPPMHELQIGRDLTKDRAEEVSQRVLDRVRTIQAHRCLHNDLRLPNIILRNWPQDVDPILIDFGVATVKPPGEPVTVYPGCGSDEVREVRRLLSNPKHGEWHIPSPYSQRINEQDAVDIGFFAVNDRIERVPERIRSLQYERVPGTDGPNAKSTVLQWRVKPGVKTRET
ncbi:hypothetical protein B0H11DRAFT_710963 [Mycena galericulata]|nr:hypothetical protein B0H11DRAFT_710963 [Mycena galericulata]